MKNATEKDIKNIGKLVKERNATSGILIYFNDETGDISAVSYGNDRARCDAAARILNQIVNNLETGEIKYLKLIK